MTSKRPPSTLDPENRLPTARYQYVNVRFDTANQDMDIRHNLNPVDPESIIYTVVKSSSPTTIYEDRSASRLPWQRTHIWLRSSIKASVTLLLTLPPFDLDPLDPDPLPETVNAFGVVHVDGQGDVEADQAEDTLTLIAGSGIVITTDPESDAVKISSTCCPDDTDFCSLMDIVYSQDWASGEGSSMRGDDYGRPFVPGGVGGADGAGTNPGTDAVDPLYPEIVAAEAVTVINVAGPDGDLINVVTLDTSLGEDGQQAGIDFALGHIDGSRGCFHVEYRPKHWTFEDVTYAPLINLVARFVGSFAGNYSVISHFNVDWDIAAGNLEFIWLENTGAGGQTATIPAPFLSREAVENQWIEFDLLWQCGSPTIASNGTISAVASDGWFQLYITQFGSQTLVYEQEDIPLLMYGGNATNVYNKVPNELNGMWLGFFGLAGELGYVEWRAPNSTLPLGGPTGGTTPLTITTVDNAIARFDGTNGNLQNSLISLSDTGALTFPDGVKQTFNPDGTTVGLNVGSQAGDPSTLANGDVWYNSTTNLLKARINGATVTLGASTAPSGADTHVQFNDGGVFGGAATLTFDKTRRQLAVDMFDSSGLRITASGNNDGVIALTNNNANAYAEISIGRELVATADTARVANPGYFWGYSAGSGGVGNIGFEINPGETPDSAMAYADGRGISMRGDGLAEVYQYGGLGTGAIPGVRLEISNNDSGNGAAGCLVLFDKAGTKYYLWVESGNLRIHTAAPTEDNTTVAHTAGTVVGTQT